MWKINFNYVIVVLLTIMLAGLYWIVDSYWATQIYNANLNYLVTHPSITFIDALSFKIPPYQATNRLLVIMIIVMMGAGAIIVSYIKDKINNKLREEAEERRRLSDILQRAKRMETVETMAGGVAHDLNNVLSGVTTYPELLLLNIDETDPMYKPIKSILEAGRQATNIVKDLSVLSKGTITKDQIIDLNYIIKEYLTSQALIQKLPQNKHIKIIPSYCKEKIYIRGSETHIFKMILNLVTNAINSIDNEYGEVRITTSIVELTKPIENYPDVRKGEYALIEVSDTGRGISEEDLDHIFEPFFTKNMLGIDGGGTGLGLTIVWAAVHEHGGYILVSSSDKGTIFKVYLPIEDKNYLEDGKAVLIKKYTGNQEAILVVDDNEIQRNILSSLLKTLNYKVVVTNSGENAIELLKAGNKFDLIILDVSMPPGITGCTTFEKIIELNPEQKAILVSGYMDSDKVKEALKLGVKYFLHKPYSIKDISEKIYKSLTNKD